MFAAGLSRLVPGSAEVPVTLHGGPPRTTKIPGVARVHNGSAPGVISPADGYRRLREAIIAGRFQPNERLVEADLSEAFGIPRAVVRTALVRLEQEGLIEHERYRGAKVRLVTEQEAIEILEARAALEAVAARRAAARVDEAGRRALTGIMDRMRAAFADTDLFLMSELNSELHARIVEIAGSATVSRLVSMLNSQIVRFQYRTILVPGRPESSLREHQAIVSAIVTHDQAGAAEAMTEHLARVVEAVSTLSRLSGGR
jgi:DNA-binding GntR family transcriptional regulator